MHLEFSSSTILNTEFFFFFWILIDFSWQQYPQLIESMYSNRNTIPYTISWILPENKSNSPAIFDSVHFIARHARAKYFTFRWMELYDDFSLYLAIMDHLPLHLPQHPLIFISNEIWCFFCVPQISRMSSFDIQYIQRKIKSKRFIEYMVKIRVVDLLTKCYTFNIQKN